MTVVSLLDNDDGSLDKDRGSVVLLPNNNNSGGIIQEQQTIYNSEAKSLIRDVYTLLYTTTTTTTSSSSTNNSNNHNNNNIQQSTNTKKIYTTIIITSILELLVTVQHSYMRHLLLDYLPHFVALSCTTTNGYKGGSSSNDLSSSNNERVGDDVGPSWLLQDNDQVSQLVQATDGIISQNQSSQSSSTTNNNKSHTNYSVDITNQIIQVFESLISTDVTTLIPFLTGTLSILFDNDTTTDDNVGGSGSQSSGDQVATCVDREEADSDTLSSGSSNSARTKVFQICTSSIISTISNINDIPSLLYILFTLVRTENEGRLVMQIVRDELSTILLTASNDDEEERDNDNLVYYIGNVIITSILSSNQSSSSSSHHLVNGYISIMNKSLSTDTSSSTQLTLLDVIILTGLYNEYTTDVESIINDIMKQSTLLKQQGEQKQRSSKSFLNLLDTLISSWLVPSNGEKMNSSSSISSDRRRRSSRDGERQHTDSILYEPLASSLISILLYIIMLTSSSQSDEQSSNDCLMGGILPYHNTAFGATLQQQSCTNHNSEATNVQCCNILSKLYIAVDTQWKQQIINSLLSMITDSFVRSSSTTQSSSFVVSSIGKRRRKKGSNSTMSSSVAREERQHFHQSILLNASRAATRTLLLISNNDVTDLLQMKGIVMDRLLLLASMSVSTNSKAIEGGGGEEEVYYHLFDMNCSLLISLLQQDTQHQTSVSDNSSNGSSSELLILCQKFLFSANYMSSSTISNSSNNNSSYQHRVICGIILACRLLRSKLIPTGDRGSIWSWIITVISPSMKESITIPLEALYPLIAQWGLMFLKFASSIIIPSMDHPEISNLMTETQPVCGGSDVFNQVNTMLAKAAIIQMEDDLKIPLTLQVQVNKEVSGFTLQSSTFLAFAETSTYDHSRKKKKKKSPTTTPAVSMVICAPYFLNGAQTTSSPNQQSSSSGNNPFLNIDLVAGYVYNLIDRYLELGTLKSGSWNPRGWLLAKVQLPTCLSESVMELLGMKKNYSLEVDCCDEDTTFQRRWKLLFTDELKSKATTNQNLVEFVNCTIISISVSCSVLKHSYQHFQKEEAQLKSINKENAESSISTPSNPNTSSLDEAKKLQRRKKKQLEALRKLLQFQVNKIHTMQRIVKNIYIALNGLHTEVCKMNAAARTQQKRLVQRSKEEVVSMSQSNQSSIDNTTPEHATYERKRIPLSELKSNVNSIESFLSSDINTIDNCILWSCIEDDSDDKILLDSLKSHPSETISSSSAARIINLRMHILQYLQQNIIQLNNTTVKPLGKYSNDISLSGIARVFQLTISLSPYLDDNKPAEGLISVEDLLSTHYKLLLAIFSFATKGIPLQSSLKSNVLHKNRKQPSTPINACGKESLFAAIIQECVGTMPSDTNAVDSASLEDGLCSSTTLATPTGTLSETLLRQLQDCNDASLASHIIDLLSIVFIHTDCSRGILAKITSDALHSVYTMSVGKANMPYMFFKLNSILLEDVEHDESDGASIVKDSFTPLIQTSNMLLKAKDPFTSVFVHNLMAHWSALILEGASQFHCLSEMVDALDSFLSTSFRRSKLSSPSRKHTMLPGLNEKTHTALFELLLHMINASLSLAKPRRNNKKKRSSNGRNQIDGPYRQVIWPMEVFGKLISIFTSNHVFFPRRVVLATIKSSVLMIRIGDYQLRRCVQWRTTQPTQMGIGMDYAAVDLLQPLIDVSSHCIGSIIVFCNTMKGHRRSGIGRGLDSTYKHNKAIAGLLYRSEGIKETLQSVCQSQDLTFPQFTSQVFISPSRMKRRSDGKDSVRRKRHRGNRELTPRRNNIRSPSSSVLESLDGSSGKRKLTSAENKNDMESDSEYSQKSGEDDNSMKGSDSDSFGVVGEW